MADLNALAQTIATTKADVMAKEAALATTQKNWDDVTDKWGIKNAIPNDRFGRRPYVAPKLTQIVTDGTTLPDIVAPAKAHWANVVAHKASAEAYQAALAAYNAAAGAMGVPTV